MRLFCSMCALAVVSGIGNAAHAAAANWEINVKEDKAVEFVCKNANDQSTCLRTDRVNILEEDATLTINCASAPLCSAITVAHQSGGKPVSTIDPAAAEGTRKRYTLGKEAFKTAHALGILHGGTPIAAIQMGIDGRDEKTQVAECEATGTLKSYPRGHKGRASRSVAVQILVDPMGNILGKSPGFLFDENDTLEVLVLGRKSVVDRLKVTRSSGFRDLSVVRVLGDTTAVPKSADTNRHADQAADPCILGGPYALDDFAPGRGTVQLAIVDGDKTTNLASFDFQVHPLYTGMFTLGWVRTDAVDPDFKIVSDGTQNVIAASNVGGKDNLYALFYTPFVWGKRDFEKPWAWDASLLDRVNPSLGVVVDDIENNVLAGISIDLPAGVVFTVGRHYRRMEVLSPQSGLALGSAFTGTADQLPTAKSWKSEKFVGLSIDLRVMAKFIATAVGGSGDK